ncbi:MAG: AMIN domain-containing protein, partial [Desulfovibrio sp.]|nr:AMIN domain-containing protein [Desulfovibrio sp.]
ARTPEPAAAPAKKTAAPEKAPAQASAAGPRTITRFVVFARDTGATVRLTGNGPLRYKSMNLENPDRVVLDLEGDWEVKAPAVPKNPLVSAVRVGDMDGRTRIVIDLKGKPRTARVIPAKTGDGVDVRVDQ